MKKVLYLQEFLFSYRVPICRRIAQKFDFTVAYIKSPENCDTSGFKAIHLKTRKIGPLIFVPGLMKLCSQYDVVILQPHMRVVSFQLPQLLPHRYKTLSWSIGVPASYTHAFSLEPENSLKFRIWKWLFRKADALIFYTKLPIPMWTKLGIDEKKCFVAHNTVEVERAECDAVRTEKRDSIVFIGTLYKQKRIDDLIDAYVAASKGRADFPRLDIIGGGDEFDRIQEMSKTYNIKLYGSVFDEKKIARIFAGAIACVSPGQGGLSILKSMGYGVPYVTRRNAVTGGELSNIIDGENGFLFDTQEELVRLISEMDTNPEKFLEAGRKASVYYSEHATPEIMAEGVVNAINYALEQK